MKLAEIVVNDFGGSPIAEHNMPCAVCRTNHAIYDLSAGLFTPCWHCQSKGWHTLHLNWFQKWVTGR